MRWVKYIGALLAFYGLVWISIHGALYRTGRTTANPETHGLNGRYGSGKTSGNETANSSSSTAGRREDPERRRPLLCLFTSFIWNKSGARPIHRSVLENWANLSPDVRPYLFVDGTERSEAKLGGHPDGWQTIRTPTYRDHLPVFREMLKTIDELVESVFIGYANDDVIFDASLPDTLRYIRRAVRNLDQRDVLLTGRRHDYVIDDVGGAGIVVDAAKVTSASSTSPLAGPEAIDYVIFSRTQFRWEQIPEMVIGASDLTNWLLASALQANFVVIEVTASVNAVRLTSRRQRHTGVASADDPNARLLSTEYRGHERYLERGRTDCVLYLTVCRRRVGRQSRKHGRCNLGLAKRRKLPHACQRVDAPRHVELARSSTKRRRGKVPESDEYDTFEGEMILL